MKKGIKKYKLQGKKTSHRDALIMSQVIELIRAQKIKTTPAKAKVLKSQFDKLVTNVKKETEAGDKVIQSFFRSNERAIERLKKVVKLQLNDRNSGYTSIVKTLPRKGDNAAQVYIMLVNIIEKAEKKTEIQKKLESQGKKVSKSKKKN